MQTKSLFLETNCIKILIRIIIIVTIYKVVYINTVKINHYWLIQVKCTNYQVKNNREYKLINIKIKVKTKPTTQSQRVECRVCKAYKGIYQVSKFFIAFLNFGSFSSKLFGIRSHTFGTRYDKDSVKTKTKAS